MRSVLLSLVLVTVAVPATASGWSSAGAAAVELRWFTDDPAYPVLSPLLHKLDLTEAQLEDLVAFLRALEEPHRRIEPPDLPRGLYGRD